MCLCVLERIHIFLGCFSFFRILHLNSIKSTLIRHFKSIIKNLKKSPRYTVFEDKMMIQNLIKVMKYVYNRISAIQKSKSSNEIWPTPNLC